MSSKEWKEVKLGEVCDTNCSSYSNSEKWNYVNYLDTGNITENKINSIQFIDLAKNKLPSRARRKLNPNDIVYSTVRPNQKHYGIIKKPFENMLVSTGFTTIRAKINMSYPQFIYYFLTQSKIVETLHTIAEQQVSTYPSIKATDIENITLRLPPLPEQKAIASTLSCLDDMIELNNRTNQVLDEMAQAIFKHWFVDFEFPNEDGQPYKSSGGVMVESELGEIPKGWRVEKLGDHVKSIDNRGKTPPLSADKTEYPIIDVKALTNHLRIIDYNNCTKHVTEETYNNWFRSGHPKELDILISTVGSLAEMKIFYGNIGCIAQNVVGLRSVNMSALYLYEYLKFIKNDLVAYNIGSVQPSIKVTHIIKHKILIPDDELLSAFHNIINVVSNEIYKNCIQSQKLSEIRDTLLPKLISGEIRVPVEEVV